ncbi:MAG TPA: recombinase family protein [Myxococcota bacterium]|nr:recombinase family protein [Myxococcota bacterium]HRY96869.1 recombinase family protein [Myxococcota bacterium]
MKKAIAYVSDVILGRTGEVISRQSQREALQKHAAENGIEIVAWFEDEIYSENVLTRPGVQAMLADPRGCDLVLVERVWSLTRNLKTLEQVVEILSGRGLRLEASATLWDCASQHCRRLAKGGAKQPVKAPVVVAETARARMDRPAKLNFLHLVRKHA